MSDPSNMFKLDANDKRSSTWVKLAAHFENKLRELRGQIEGDALTESQTAILRGQIKTLKSLIALGDDRPPFDGQ